MPLSQMPDARIALSGDSQQPAPNILGTLGQMMQIKEQQSILQERQQQEQAQRRALEDDAAIRNTLPRYARPDEAIDDLYKQGRATAAAKLGTSIYNQRKAQTEAYDQQLVSSGKRLDQAAQIMQGVTDDAGYQVARKAAVGLLQPVYGDGINDLLPTTYDPAHVKQLIAAGTKRSEQITAEHQAAQDLISGYNAGAISNPYGPGGKLDAQGSASGPQWSDNAQKVWDGYLKAASRVLPQAQNKAQWDGYVQTLVQQGAPQHVIDQLPQWNDADPAAARKAATQLGLTSKDKADIANQEATRRQEGQRIGIEQERADTDKTRAETAASGAGQPKPLTPHQESDLIVKRNLANTKAKAVYDKETADAGGDNDLKKAADDTFRATRLQNENNYRTARFMPTMEEAAQAAIDNGDRQSYDIIAKKYDAYAGPGSLAKALPWPGTPTSRPLR